MAEATHTVTFHLERMAKGEAEARDQVFHLCYAELKKRAMHLMDGQFSGHTLQPTALVHEAYLKLAGGNPLQCRDREHFLAIAGRAMRQVLIDHVRARGQQKRGGQRVRIALDDVIQWYEDQSVDLLRLDEVLNELERFDPMMARAIEYRFFGGLSVREAADQLGLHLRTFERNWKAAKAWLAAQLK